MNACIDVCKQNVYICMCRREWIEDTISTVEEDIEWKYF